MSCCRNTCVVGGAACILCVCMQSNGFVWMNWTNPVIWCLTISNDIVSVLSTCVHILNFWTVVNQQHQNIYSKFGLLVFSDLQVAQTQQNFTELEAILRRMEKLCANHPQDGECWCLYAQALIFFGQFAEAEEVYVKAVAKCSDNPRILIQRA